jgi:adenylate cyclase
MRVFARAERLIERIVIVDIDERSLVELGRWPWNRARLAALIEQIFERYGALLLGLDVILAEADESSGLPALEALGRGPLRQHTAFQAALAELRPELDYDGRLAKVLHRYPVILGFHLSHGEAAARSGALPLPLLPEVAVQAGQFSQWNGYGANLPRLQQAAIGAGFLSAPVELDGVTRRAWLLAAHDGQVYAALSLVMVQVLLGNPALQLRFADHAPWQSAPRPVESIELLTARARRDAFLSPSRRASCCLFEGVWAAFAIIPPPMYSRAAYRLTACTAGSYCWAPRHRACSTSA